MCSIFQTDTVPGQFRFHDLISPASWLHLITHPPFLAVLAAAVTGAAVYGRVFGIRVVTGLLRNLFKSKRKK